MEKEYIEIRKVGWDMLWHAVYIVAGQETWDRVTKDEALRLAALL